MKFKNELSLKNEFEFVSLLFMDERRESISVKKVREKTFVGKIQKLVVVILEKLIIVMELVEQDKTLAKSSTTESSDYQEELRSLGWQFDSTGLLRQYNEADKDDHTREETRARASNKTLVKMSDEYLEVRAAVHRYLVAVLTHTYHFTIVALGGTGAATAASVPIYLSPGALEKESILVIVMGKGESLAPAWVTWVCKICVFCLNFFIYFFD